MIPSNEKISIEEFDDIKLIVLIKFEKDICVFKKPSPISRIAREIFDRIEMNISIRKNEKFIHIPHNNNLNKKLIGCSMGEYVKWEKIYLAEKYIINPSNNELAISSIPEEVEFPKKTSKLGSFKIFDEIKTKLSNTSYKLFVIDIKS